jgi:hypothetical protein
MMPLLTLAAAFLFAGSADGPSKKAEPESVTLRGKVVLLADALRAKGLNADLEPISAQVALLAEDGVITLLLSDEASRALFLDKRLRGRRTEITGLRVAGVPYIQVVTFKIEEDGAMRTPEYYCEICAIHVRYPQICPCCQGPMILQMKPEGR